MIFLCRAFVATSLLGSVKASSKENSSAPLDELLHAIELLYSVANSSVRIDESQSSAPIQYVSGNNDSSFDRISFRINDFESTYRSLLNSSAIIQESGSEGQQNNSTGISNNSDGPGSTYVLAKVTENHINDTLIHSFINVNYKDSLANFSVFIKQPGKEGNQNSTIQSYSLRGNNFRPKRHTTVSSEIVLNPDNKGTQRESLGNFSEIVKDSGRQARESALTQDDFTPFDQLHRKVH